MAETASTRLAVLGSPISHSRSPALHTAAYRALGRDWSYERRELEVGALAPFLSGLGPSWRGVSLTMPLKQEAARLADILDAPARLTHAANTLLLPAADGHQLRGFNTDVGGIVRAIHSAGVAPGVALVLGSGATAASAVLACVELGAERVVVAARNRARAEALNPLAASAGVRSEAVAPEEGVRVPADLVISTIPGEAAAALPWPDERDSSALLLDVPYDPWPSPLGAAWLASGARLLSGLEMLVQQALLQVRVFVAGDPEVALPSEPDVLTAMLAAVEPEPGASSS